MKSLRKFLALFLALCMLTGMLGTAAFAAEEPEAPAEEQAVVCAALEGCTEEAHAEGCPLYVAPVEEEPEVEPENLPMTELTPAAPAEEEGEEETLAADEESVDLFAGGEETGYDGAALPEEPDMSGTTVTVTPDNAQYTLDGAYGSIDGKTIHFSEGTYEALELGRATKYAGSGTLYYKGGNSTENPVELADIPSEPNGVYTYVRTMSNVTFTAEDGATLAGFYGGTGHHSGDGYDYVRDTATVNSVKSYYLMWTMENLTFDGLTIEGKFNFACSGTQTDVDGITFRNCTFTGTGTASADGRAIRMQTDLENCYKNLTVNNCDFTNYYQGVYIQGPENLTVQGCEFTTLGHNAIAAQSGGPNTARGAIVLSGNTFTDVNDRCIRFGNIGADSEITVSENTAINSGDDAGEIMKAENIASTASITIDENNDWGEGKTVNSGLLPVAEVDGKGYTSLQGAIDAAQTGETVVLLKDGLEVTDPIALNGVNLDLGGNTIKNGSSFDVLLTDGAVTVKNGTIELSNQGAAAHGYRGIYVRSGHTTAKGLTIRSSDYTDTEKKPWEFGSKGVYVEGTAAFTLAADSTIKSNGYGVVAYGAGPTIHIYGTIVCCGLKDIYSPAAISGNGTFAAAPGSTINIYEGATVRSLYGVAVYHPQMGQLNITGGLVEGYAGIGIKSGVLNITGNAVVRGTGEKTQLSDADSTGNGIENDGSAIVIDTHTSYAGQMILNIADSATVESDYSYAIREIRNVNATGTNVVKLTASGNATVTGVEGCISLKDPSVGSISGGTFSHDVNSYCAEGMEWDETTHGIVPAAGKVAQIVGGGAYDSLQAAVEAADAGDTVKLLTDTSGSGVIVRKSIIIDFNEKAYTVSKSPVGSSGTETQAFQLLAGNDLNHPNTVTMKNGTIILPSTTLGLKMGIQNYTNLTLDGMTLDASGNSNIQYVLSNNNGSSTITGGTVIKAAEGRVAFDVYDSRSYPQVAVSVIDATIEGVIEVSKNPEKVKLTISGGSFDREIPAEYCGEGFLPVAKADGTYGVDDTALSITPNRTSQRGRGTVTLTVAPANLTLAVTVSCDVEGITVTENADGTFSATLPNTTATYTFTATVEGQEPVTCEVRVTRSTSGGGTTNRPTQITDPDVPLAQPLPFTDVAEGDWYHEAVRFVFDQGMMKGTNEEGTVFAPLMTTNRAMIVAILYRLAGEPAAAPASFTDVAEGQWYTQAVAWAAENGVVEGYGDGTFGPNDSITREQLAALLWRYAGKPAAPELTLSFTDADQVSDYAQEALRWAVGQGIITGKGGDILDPKGTATRAEAAQMLMRFSLLQKPAEDPEAGDEK